MREIKFRAWDNQRKEMFFPEEMIFLKNGKIDIRPSGGINNDWRVDYDLMQFTGLHDKNGKEIYEGAVLKDDLLDDSVPTILSVVWRNNIAGFAAKEIPNDAWLLLRQGHYEVIGNIYENPNLLTKD